MNTKELAALASLIENEMRSGSMFVYDYASGDILPGSAIATARLINGSVIQLDFDREWHTRLQAHRSQPTTRKPWSVLDVDGDHPDVRERVLLMRSVVQASQIEILDPASGFAITPDLIANVSANGHDIQITLYPIWHARRRNALSAMSIWRPGERKI